MADPTIRLTWEYSPAYAVKVGYTLPALSDTDTPFPVVSSTDCSYPGSGTPVWPASCTVIDGTSSPTGTQVYGCTDGKQVYYFHDGTTALAELDILDGMTLIYSSSTTSEYANWAAYNSAVGTELFIDVPTSVLESEVEYTFSLRVTITSNHRWEYWVRQTGRWDHYQCPQYATNSSASGWVSIDGVVNHVPVISAVSTNGEASPKLANGATPVFMFRVTDDDGPDLNYLIEAGAITPSGFVLNDELGADVGRVVGGRDFEISYEADLEANVEYAWRIMADDDYPYGDGKTSWSSFQYFRINALAYATSLEMGGEELLTGVTQTIGSQDVLVEWVYYDPEGATQTAYRLVLTPSAGGTPITYEASGSASSFTIPLIPPGQYAVTFSLKDDMEYGRVSTGTIISNARPRATSLEIDGEVNPSNVTVNPTIQWTFRDDDEDDSQQKYRVQVATDASFQGLVWDTGEIVGATDDIAYGAVPGIVGPIALTHQQYYFRVQVYDGVSWSSFASDGYGSFYYNNPPGDPTLASPGAGTYSSLSVSWAEAVPADADGDPVTYAIEMTDKFSYGTGWRQVAGPIPEGTTSWNINLAEYKAGDNYGVRIVASDGITTSDPSNGGTSPRFTVDNHAPVTPTITSPVAGSTSAQRIVVEWHEADPVDVDDDAVLYKIWITVDGGASWTLAETIPAGNSRAVLLAGDYESGGCQVRMQAVDQNGATGAYQYSGEFQLDNSSAANDFEKLNGITYVSTIDGRLRKVVGRNWTLEQPWSYGPPIEFEAFAEGDPSVTIKDGKLQIAPKAGSTFILRQAKDE